MGSIDHEIVNGGRENYYVNCHECRESFNAALAPWCHCESKTRSVVCPSCSQCSCRAPVYFRERFWASAPRALRENTNRFRLGDGSEAAPAGSPFGAPRILIIDDEEDMRSLVACYVEQMGYEVTTVSNPVDALLLLAANDFDVVITDALMPRMDGRVLCQNVKELYGEAVKVIVMSSLYTATRYKTEARYRFHADDFLAKPLQFRTLNASLNRVAPIAGSQASALAG